jgi:hypothetical protein
MDLGKALLELGRNAGDTGFTCRSNSRLLAKTLLRLDERFLAPDFYPNESMSIRRVWACVVLSRSLCLSQAL